MWRRFRERVNLLIYDSKGWVLSLFRLLNILVTLGALGTLVYYYGYPQTPETIELCLFLLKCGFGFYVLHFLLRLFFDFEPIKFLKEHWLESLLMLILFIEGLSSLLFGKMILQTFFQSVGLSGFSEFTTAFIQLYFFFVLLIEVTRTYETIPFVKVHPATLFVFTFILIILVGAFLLMLPEMTTIKGSMSFVDALFTSTSATCVTGLSVVDPSTYFTFKGQVVIMLMIKIG